METSVHVTFISLKLKKHASTKKSAWGKWAFFNSLHSLTLHSPVLYDMGALLSRQWPAILISAPLCAKKNCFQGKDLLYFMPARQIWWTKCTVCARETLVDHCRRAIHLFNWFKICSSSFSIMQFSICREFVSNWIDIRNFRNFIFCDTLYKPIKNHNK